MTSAEPSLTLIIGSLFLGLLISVFWTVTGHLITIAHEGSHALFGSLMGGRIRSVKIMRDQGGETAALINNEFVFTFAGYVGPSLFGMFGAILLINGLSPDAVLWASFVLLVIIFVQMKNFFGFFITALWGALFLFLARHHSAGIRALAAYTWIWFLLLGGFLHAVLDNTARQWSDDAQALGKAWIPAGFWGRLWWLATLAALIYGGGILLGLIDPPFRPGP